MTPLPKGGLYAITDSYTVNDKQLTLQVRQAIDGGAVMVQYRDKRPICAKRRKNVVTLLKICRQHRVPFIINDHVELARDVGADGVHLGENDVSLIAARQMLGEQAIIGLSCYDSYDNAVTAQKEGADYIALGRFFPSTTKPNAVQAPFGLINKIKKNIVLPLVAIGGITPENGPLLLHSGADFLAVVSGIFSAANPATAAARYKKLFCPS